LFLSRCIFFGFFLSIFSLTIINFFLSFYKSHFIIGFLFIIITIIGIFIIIILVTFIFNKIFSGLFFLWECHSNRINCQK
jgi:hypothetical protein